MPDSERQDERLSDRVVREAVSIGLETPLREPILEAVEDVDDLQPSGRRRLPLAGAGLALGAAVGYLVGTKRESVDADALSIDELEGPELLTDGDDEPEAEPDEPEPAVEIDADEEAGGSRLRRLLVALGIVGAIVLLRRRFASSEEEPWEPIEEFEPAVDLEESSDADDSEVEEEETTPSVNEETEE